jgi:hypothetical protein
VRVPLVDVPAHLTDGARAGALIVDGAVAIRRLEAFDATGRRVRRSPLRSAPAAPCRRGEWGEWGFSGGTSIAFLPGLDLEYEGPAVVRARDAGARICLSLGDFAPLRRDCRLPPGTGFGTAIIAGRRTPRRTLLGGVLPVDDATVEIEVDGARRRFATTGDLPGYGGRYRDAVRFLAVELPGAPRVGWARYLDAGDREIVSLPVFFAERPRVTGSRAVRLGGLDLRLAGYETSSLLLLSGDTVCIAVAGRSTGQCRGTSDLGITAEATCAPRRRLIVAGGVAAGARRVDVLTDAGIRRARILRVNGRRLFVAVLPADQALRRVTIRGRGVRVAELRLPPAGRQCGYDATAAAGLVPPPAGAPIR